MRTNILKKSNSFPGVQHDHMEYKCNQCGKKTSSDINGPCGWVHMQIKPDGYDFCCLSCAFKGIGKLIYVEADAKKCGPDCHLTKKYGFVHEGDCPNE